MASNSLSEFQQVASTRYRQVIGDGPFGCLNCAGDVIQLFSTLAEAKEATRHPCTLVCSAPASHKIGKLKMPDTAPAPFRIPGEGIDE